MTMQTIEQLKAAQAAQIEALEKQLAYSEAAPITPDGVMLGKLAPWLIYRKRTLSQALDIFRAYTVEPMHLAKSACTEIAPADLYHGKNMQVKSGPYAMAITVDKGEGFGPSVKIKFYGMLGDTVAQVGIDIEGPDYIGVFHALTPSFNEIRNARTGRVESRSFNRNCLLASLTDDVVSWSTGDFGQVKKSASHTYLLCAETESRTPGAENLHACGQFQNLIDATADKGA
jgi:hypothetical protein